jgi:hypothetical protein
MILTTIVSRGLIKELHPELAAGLEPIKIRRLVIWSVVDHGGSTFASHGDEASY